MHGEAPLPFDGEEAGFTTDYAEDGHSGTLQDLDSNPTNAAPQAGLTSCQIGGHRISRTVLGNPRHILIIQTKHFNPLGLHQ